jgi:hypothetical protein
MVIAHPQTVMEKGQRSFSPRSTHFVSPLEMQMDWERLGSRSLSVVLTFLVLSREGVGSWTAREFDFYSVLYLHIWMTARLQKSERQHYRHLGCRSHRKCPPAVHHSAQYHSGTSLIPPHCFYRWPLLDINIR